MVHLCASIANTKANQRDTPHKMQTHTKPVFQNGDLTNEHYLNNCWHISTEQREMATIHSISW